MSDDATSGAEDAAKAEDATKMTEAPTDLGAASRRLLEESFNEGKFGAADELLAPEAVNHDPATPPQMRALRGPEAARRAAEMYRRGFPDLRITVDDVIVGDDMVALRWHSEGTHRGELAGFAPTGVRASATGMSIDRWKDGKIVEAWTEWDNLGLARQLGAAPPEGSPGEKIGTMLQRLMARRMRKKNAAS